MMSLVRRHAQLKKEKLRLCSFSGLSSHDLSSMCFGWELGIRVDRTWFDLAWLDLTWFDVTWYSITIDEASWYENRSTEKNIPVNASVIYHSLEMAALMTSLAQRKTWFNLTWLWYWLASEGPKCDIQVWFITFDYSTRSHTKSRTSFDIKSKPEKPTTKLLLLYSIAS